jgi:hypothetical protein
MVRQAHHPEPSRRANPNDRNPKFKTVGIIVKYQHSDPYVSEIGFSDLDIICYLGIGIWDFSTVSGEGTL